MYKAIAARSRFSLFLVVCFLMVTSAKAQSVLVFENKEIDLGYMPEDTGNVVVDFKLTNVSSSSALIKEMDTHGGCTIVSYPKDSIAPGAKAKITVRVNPKNRPGPFVRKITLRSFPDSVMTELYIKSYVEPSVKVWNGNTNETSYGEVVLSSDYIRVGSVLENAKVEKSIKIKNTGKETVRFISSKFKKPTYVAVKGLPEKLMGGEEATITFTIDFASSNKLGNYTDLVELYAEPGNPKEIIVYLIGKVIPAPAASATKPVVQMLLNEIDLHEIPLDKPAEGSFVVKNAGTSPLVIRKIETSCSCLAMESPVPVAAGQSATFYFTLDPRGLSGVEEKKIIVYTNAPDQPIITLLVKAKVGP
ncbi:MAG TPA: DUF1573 domain-containing protein [Cytophagaceae bacterium]|jgi:hypothetical protein|nr:DUF1573 domain-containing protein [Cytophagaceae bacterium]